MTIVFVHGNPETDAIWGDLHAAMGRTDLVALSPPGFGTPVPTGFGATSDDYMGWLIGELEKFDAPVDLVGHDWGGGHVVRAVAARPDLVRKWCTDIAGCFNTEYVWHDNAQIWQTPGAGEEAVAAMAALPLDDLAAGFASIGMSPAAARSCASAAPHMGPSILALYRSAVQPRMAEWGARMPRAASAGRSLVMIALDDHYTGGEVLARRSAERWGSEVAVLEGCGHWWMLQQPERGAAVLNTFFGSADS
jgi:pimeloyl-ACP methyl ester carboxylesterase